MIANLQFAEDVRLKSAPPHFSPGLRRIDELLAVVLAQYAELSDCPSQWNGHDRHGLQEDAAARVSPRPR